MAQAFSTDAFPAYVIKTVCFDEDGNEIGVEGVCSEYDTGWSFLTFAIVKPAIENARVGMSPYGQSILADAIDAIQVVDLAFDAMIELAASGAVNTVLAASYLVREFLGLRAEEAKALCADWRATYHERRTRPTAS